MKLEFSVLQIFILIVYFKSVQLVPDKYCLPPLNKSDCGVPPTPVFSYYKPGSRCEIEIWRGCPTQNKFENEFHCSHYCIGRLKFYGRERGSWSGRDRNSIDAMSLKELEDLNKILHTVDNSINNQVKEKLINVSPHLPHKKAEELISKKKVKEVTGVPTDVTSVTDETVELVIVEHLVTMVQAEVRSTLYPVVTGKPVLLRKID